MATTANDSIEIAMKLKLSTEAREKLARCAAEAGKDVADVASDLIEQAVVAAPAPDSARQFAALESFATGMTAWTSAHLPPGHEIDDSREAIYEGRGG